MMISTPLVQPIALFGGTFDPIHLGHLQTALEIQQTYQLAEVRFIPCWQPVHRSLPIATPEQRLAMVACAIENIPTFKIEDCEIQRHQPSFTIETLELLRQKLPHTPLCFILGLDAWRGFAEWQRYEDILCLAHLIIAMRPSYSLPQSGKTAELLQRYQTHDTSVLHTSLGGNIVVHTLSERDISATEIRRQILEGKNPGDLLPNGVYDYIVKHRLYRE